MNKKPFITRLTFNMRFRQNTEEMRKNSFLFSNLVSRFIMDRSYKVITYIQRKSLNEKFFESEDLAVELRTSFINSKILESFFVPKGKYNYYKINK